MRPPRCAQCAARSHPSSSRRSERSRGQALVEFSLVLIPFLFIVLGIVDVGRGMFVYNSVSEAAREIARVTSVHPGADISQQAGWSAQMQAVVATQEGLVPGLTDSGIAVVCTDMTGTARPSSECFVGTTGRYVQVTVTVPFNVVLFDFLPVQPTLTFTSVSHVQIS